MRLRRRSSKKQRDCTGVSLELHEILAETATACFNHDDYLELFI